MGTPVGSRVATATLRRVAKGLWGFEPNLMADIVEQEGAGRAIVWFVRNMPRYESTRKRFGPVRTHVLTVAISTLNGCRYCTYGHAYALNLCYLAEHDALFPLDEHELVALRELPEKEAVARLEGALAAAGRPEDVEPLRRLLELRDASVPAATDDDRRIRHLASMLGTLNRCGISGNVAPDEAHDQVNRDTRLKERYARLRQGAGGP